MTKSESLSGFLIYSHILLSSNFQRTLNTWLLWLMTLKYSVISHKSRAISALSCALINGSDC